MFPVRLDVTYLPTSLPSGFRLASLYIPLPLPPSVVRCFIVVGALALGGLTKEVADGLLRSGG